MNSDAPMLSELYRYRGLLGMLAWRDIRVRYKQSLLGVAWAFLMPLIQTAVMVLVFQYGAITVNKEGKFFLNTQQVSLAELESRLGSARAAFPMMQVVVKGDATTNYQGIMDVLNVAGGLGITQVGLATKNAK